MMSVSCELIIQIHVGHAPMCIPLSRLGRNSETAAVYTAVRHSSGSAGGLRVAVVLRVAVLK
jgi:hypothetical protein